MPRANNVVKADPHSPADVKPDVEPDIKPYTRSPTKGKKTALFYGEKRTGSWSNEEDKALFEMVFPKQTKVNWESVVQNIEGRDVTSCKSRLVTLQKRLDDFFKTPSA